ncbi:Hypothetical protein PBC10988_7650 [Planctomycetales bacterium 10988]|nr:Hypothetical protein PBC10988_7650 [Planctomycetales bacterium 10988]
MFSFSRQTFALLAILAGSPWLVPEHASAVERQFYTEVVDGPVVGFQYQIYYYLPKASDLLSDAQPEHHYLIQAEQYPDYAFFYDPEAKLYWARTNATEGAIPQMSVLPESERRATLAAIDFSKFPPFSPPTYIPDSTDGKQMQLPSQAKVVSFEEETQNPEDLPADVLGETVAEEDSEEAKEEEEEYDFPKIEIIKRKPSSTGPRVVRRPTSSRFNEPEFRYETRYHIRYVPRVRYIASYATENGRPIYVPRVYYEKEKVPYQVKVRIDPRTKRRTN